MEHVNREDCNYVIWELIPDNTIKVISPCIGMVSEKKLAEVQDLGLILH